MMKTDRENDDDDDDFDGDDGGESCHVQVY